MGFFKRRNWTVTNIYIGGAPDHDLKYARFKTYFENSDPSIMPVRIHKVRCAMLAMDQTATKETDQWTKKDKSSEKDTSFPQEQSTHLPDCFDQGAWAVLELKRYPLRSRAIAFVGMRG